jgi:SNF2 family DNA or RNA helicase
VRVRLQDVAPALAEATSNRAYQRQAVLWGLKHGSFLLADQQGLGKTVETLATIIKDFPAPEEGSRYHVIFTPSVAVDAIWGAEIARWVPEEVASVLVLKGTLKEREKTLRCLLDTPASTPHVFVVANIESARVRPSYRPDRPHTPKYARYVTKDAVVPSLHSIRWDTVIVDECQRALIRTSGTKTQTRAGFELLSKNSDRRIALSGTPMRGRPEQLWGTLNWLRPNVYTSYWAWVKRYFHLTSNGYSQYVLNGLKGGAGKTMADDLTDIMLRRTKAEVLPDLPPKTYAGTYAEPHDPHSPFGTWLEPLPKQAAQLAEFERDAGLDFGDDGELLAQGPLAEYTRRKQLANAYHVLDPSTGKLIPTLDSPKYEWLVQWLENSDGEKIVVASQFTTVINTFAAGLRELGYTVEVLTGETPQKKRAQMVEKFQTTNEVQVFMLNTRAGGVALTLDSADYLVLLDETTVPDDQEQVEDRIHRASRMHNTTIYYLRTLGTLDEEIAYVAAARQDVQQYLLDGARGVAYAKALYHEKRDAA